MSSFITHDGVSYDPITTAVFYTDDSRTFSAPKDATVASNTALWVPWGDGNDEPALIADDIENTPALQAVIELLSRLTVGRGPAPYLLVDQDKDGNETLEWVDDAEIADWLELNQHFEYSYRNINNILAYGWGATQFVLNKGKTFINRIRATDTYSARLEKMDGYAAINNMYLDADWSTAPQSYTPARTKRVQLLGEGYELQELEESKLVEFGMLHRLIKNGVRYYPKPMHRASKAWVKISRSIPNIKNAANLNQMNIKYVINISETYWKRMHKLWESYPPEKKQEVVDAKKKDINDWLSGELNAGKSIIAGSYYDQATSQYVDDITITVLDDKLKDGKMLPDNAAADKQIFLSSLTNPATLGTNLLGDGASGGAGSGSDIREAVLALQAILHPERQKNLAAFNLVKNFNGWSKRLEVQRTSFATSDTGTNTASVSRKKITPRLVWRYNNTLLTTLDTGKQQKQTNN